MTTNLSYKDAGVDIDAGDRAVELMKAHLAKARRAEVIGDIGGFVPGSASVDLCGPPLKSKPRIARPYSPLIKRSRTPYP